MGRKSKFAFFLLLALYSTGLLAGSLYQVKINQQTEMYEYLTGGVSAYSQTATEGIKAALKDNAPEFLALLLSAFLPFGLYVIGAIVAIRGFLTGFAITCAMRVYGFLGASLCMGNLLSAALAIPCLVCYGVFVYTNAENIGKVRLGALCGLYLLLLLAADGVIKGGLSPIATGLWQ